MPRGSPGFRLPAVARSLPAFQIGARPDGLHLTRLDDRKDYGEPRYISAGRLNGRIVIIVWSPRGKARRIISMRKANERDIERLAPHLA